MKTILVIVNGNVLTRIKYKTATEAKKNYNHFIKKGMASYMTGLPIENATFNLIP